MKQKLLSLILFIGLLSVYEVAAQTPCTIGNMGSFTTIAANAYPHTNNGITANATTAGGVPTLSNTSYNCGGTSFATTSPAWWLNAAGQSITITFSQPVSSFAVIVNGTGNGEEFYFTEGATPGGSGVGCLSDFCMSGDWQVINGGSGLLYNGGGSSGSLITINNPGGATQYTLSHNGLAAGSRIALVDCFVAAGGGGGGTIDIDPIADETVCDSYTFPAITGSGLSGNEAYYDGPGGAGNQYNVGDVFSTTGTTTLYAYDPGSGCVTDEEQFDITINPTPDITSNPGNQTVCDSYTLPAIAGNNLTGNEAYYDGTGGTGTQYAAGDVITTSTTLYIYDETGGIPNCTDEETFGVTVNMSPDITNPGDQTVCDSYTLPVIVGNNLTGNEAYYDGSGGTGTQYAAGDVITTTTTLYIYDETGTTPNCTDEETFDVTVNLSPEITNPGDQAVCDLYTLPVIVGNNLTGNEAYYDGTGGTGTQYAAGDVITTTITLYIYDETGTTPNCTDEETFDVTVNLSPEITNPGDQTVCDSYTLPAITGNNLTGNEAYYDGSGGTGTQYAAGDVITATTTLYIYDETAGTTPNCTDEETFNINIETTPDIDPISDDLVCGAYTFPNITGSNLSGNEAFYTGTGGTGTQYFPGDNVNNTGTTTYYIYDETAGAGCSDEESFSVSIGSSLTISVSYTDPSTCNGSDGEIVISGLSINTNYDIIYTDDGTSVGPNTATSNGNGEIVISGLDAGDYSDFEVTFGACVGTDNSVLTLTDPNVPPLNIVGQTLICEGETSTLSTDLNGNHIWRGGSTGNTLDVDTTGTYWVEVDNGTGCIAYDTISVVVSEELILDIDPIPETCIDEEDGTVEVEIVQGDGPLSYNWLNGDTSANPMFAPGVYTVNVTNDYGCSYQDTVEIDAATEECPEPSVYIPNIFSPNGDGINDVFEVYGEEIRDLSVQVFDRWGKLVYYSATPEAKWDGTKNGKPMNTAVFAYLIRVTFEDGTYEDYKGNVTLVRKEN